MTCLNSQGLQVYLCGMEQILYLVSQYFQFILELKSLRHHNIFQNIIFIKIQIYLSIIFCNYLVGNQINIKAEIICNKLSISHNLKLEMSKLVQNYLLQEPVGKGVYGQVFRAIHQKTKAQYAVKVIPKSSFRSNPKLEQLAINEINILSSLKNDHIVKFIETLKTPNNFYFVYQFCNDGTIESLIKKRKILKQSEALIYFNQLLDAFKELNKNNVMHRDLKPDNIFLLDGQIKLGDFGFCKMLQVNMAQTMLGSPIYMAPQILRQEIYTSKADIWSLGVVLFEMLFGYCPFQSSSISELINKLKQMDLEIPKHINPISESTEILLRKMLVKDQFKRIQWVDLFDFVIDDRGIIVGGCKKQYAIETLEKYFLNQNQQTPGVSTGTINIDQITDKIVGENNSDSKRSEDKSQINSQEWNTIGSLPRISSTKKVTSVQHLVSKNSLNEKDLFHGSSSGKIQRQDNEFKSSVSIQQKRPESTTKISTHTPNIGKDEKQKFGKIHKQWLESINYISEWVSGNSQFDEKIIYLLLVILVSKIQDQSNKYPEWTDVLIEEKRAIKQAIQKLKRDKKETRVEEGQKQLFRMWKQNKSEYFEKAIRAVCLNSNQTSTIQQILAS